MVVDLPDNTAAAGICAAVSASGYVTLSTTPILTAEELDKALTVKGLKYRGPGE